MNDVTFFFSSIQLISHQHIDRFRFCNFLFWILWADGHLGASGWAVKDLSGFYIGPDIGATGNGTDISK